MSKEMITRIDKFKQRMINENLDVNDYINQLNNNEYSKLSDELYSDIEDEGWLDELENFYNRKFNKNDFSFTTLNLTSKDKNGLIELDDDVIEKFNDFDIELKSMSEYPFNKLDLIDYDNGVVYIIRLNMELRKFKTTLRDFLNEQKKLNEASFHSFDNDDILTDEYIKNFINSDDVADNLLDWYIQSNDLDVDDEESIRLSQDYYEYIKDELYRHLEDAKENIYDKIDYYSNKITLYRAITVDDNWLHHLKTQGKRLGIYWSWDDSGAETHWGDPSKKNEAVIEAEIDEKYVDWKTTFEMNMHPNYSEEKEIRLFKNTPIKVKSIKINDKEIDISILGNKVFYS